MFRVDLGFVTEIPYFRRFLILPGTEKGAVYFRDIRTKTTMSFTLRRLLSVLKFERVDDDDEFIVGMQKLIEKSSLKFSDERSAKGFQGFQGFLS